MSKRMWKIAGVVTALFMFTGFIDLRLAAGFLLGVIAALVLYARNTGYWNGIVDGGTVGKTTGIMHFFVNYAIMAGVLLAGALLPQYLNIFTCAAGMMIIKWTAYIEAFLPKRGNE